MIVELTDHAIKRAKERFNLSERVLRRTAQKAFETGIHHELARGRIKKWALKHLRDRANHVRFLGLQAFLFHDHHLITVLRVPNRVVLMNRPKEEFEEEDLESDEGIPDVR